MPEINKYLVLYPQFSLIALGALILLLDLFWVDGKRRLIAWIVAAWLAITAVTTGVLLRPGGEAILFWGNVMRWDWVGFTFCILLLSGTALAALFSLENETLYRRGEFYLLLVASTLGMTLMATAADLILLYLALELASMPLYVLAGFMVKDEKSTEAGIKYLLYGALASAVMLYGLSLLYGFSSTTNIYLMAQALQTQQASLMVVIAGMAFTLAGFGYKIAAVPFHFWAPDVYEGAPTPVAGFLSTVSKTAGFAIIIRVLASAFPIAWLDWRLVMAVVAAATMLLGNLLAIQQKNLKRLLAYSSISHAGYILVGVAAGSAEGYQGVLYYLAGYLVSNLLVFGILALLEKEMGSSDLSALEGLHRRSPGLALAMLVAILSLAGIPPLAGFAGKLFVFIPAVNAGLWWLVLFGVVNSVIGLYYYLNILKVVYAAPVVEGSTPPRQSGSFRTALWACVALILFLGVVFTPWLGWASLAGKSVIP